MGVGLTSAADGLSGALQLGGTTMLSVNSDGRLLPVQHLFKT